MKTVGRNSGLILVFSLSITLSLKAQVIFQKEYDSGIQGKYELGTLIDGYLIAGSSLINTAGGIDGFAMKTDLSGNTIWSKNYGGVENDQFFSMCKASNGNFILAGKTESFVYDLFDESNVYLIEIDTSGNLVRSKSIGIGNNEKAFSVKRTDDDGYVIAGYSDSLGVVQPLLIKTDSLLNVEWSHRYNTVAYDVNFIQSVIQTNDGGYAFTGFSTLSTASIDTNLFVVKTDPLGIPEFSKHFFFNDVINYTERGAYGYDIIQNYDGNLVVVGAVGGYYQSVIRPYTPLMLVLNLAGDVISSKQLYMNTGDSRARNVQQTLDGNYILGGYMGNYFMLLIKLIGLNDVNWNFHYDANFTTPSQGFSVSTTYDDGFVLVGSLISTGSIRVVKTNEVGFSGCDQEIASTQSMTDVILLSQQQTWGSTDDLDTVQCLSSANFLSPITNIICFNDYTGLNEHSPNENIGIFPNPANEFLHLKSTGEPLERFKITDAFGCVVYEKSYDLAEEIIIDISGFSEGIYILSAGKENIKFYKN